MSTTRIALVAPVVIGAVPRATTSRERSRYFLAVLRMDSARTVP